MIEALLCFFVHLNERTTSYEMLQRKIYEMNFFHLLNEHCVALIVVLHLQFFSRLGSELKTV